MTYTENAMTQTKLTRLKVSPEVMEALQTMKVVYEDGYWGVIIQAATNLDIWADICKHLKAIGGAYNGDEDVFVFTKNPIIRLNLLLRAGETVIVSTGFVQTPYPVGLTMCEHARLQTGMTLLEPSAGYGALLRAIDDYCREAGIVLQYDAIERDTLKRSVLDLAGWNVLEKFDFLLCTPDRYYDRIIMHPPFEDETAHILQAMRWLKPGGRLVSLMSTHPFHRNYPIDTTFRSWFGHVKGQIVPLPDKVLHSENGLDMNACIVIIDKDNVRGLPKPPDDLWPKVLPETVSSDTVSIVTAPLMEAFPLISDLDTLPKMI